LEIFLSIITQKRGVNLKNLGFYYQYRCTLYNITRQNSTLLAILDIFYEKNKILAKYDCKIKYYML